MCLHLQRETQAVGERTVPCGGYPTTPRHEKESLEWQMASESHILNFSLKNAWHFIGRDMKLELHQLMSRQEERLSNM